MKDLVLVFSLLIGINAYSGGGEMLLEFGYYSNGTYQIGYLPIEFTNTDLSGYLEDQEGFAGYLLSQQVGEAELTFYSEIINQEKIAAMASFPIHPYMIVDGSSKAIKKSNLRRLKLLKIWKRSSYHIHVLTPLVQDDRYWLREKPTVIKNGFQDVGCRLEIYDHGNNGENLYLYEKLMAIYPNDGNYPSENQLEKMTPIIEQLKEKKVVVVELCGC